MSLLDNFPSNLHVREAQKEILDAIQENLKSGYRKIILSAPTRIGKSAVARKERLEEMRNLNKKFNVQDESGKIIYPGSGNASNPQTTEYLEAFMKLHPSKDLPPFVRRKWSNVKKLLQKKSNQKISRFFGE